MLILLFAVDFGRLYFGWINLQSAARVGASYAAFHPDAWGIPGDPAAQAAYAAQIRNDATTINCALPTTLPTPSFPDGNVIGGRAQVNLTCGFGIITPIISSIVGNPLSLGATAIFPIRAGLLALAPNATPTPAVTPTPAPTATPGQCTVPTFLGTHANDAQAAWNAAGFVPTLLNTSIGNGNYVISTENPPNVDGSLQNCATFALTIGHA